MAVRWPNLNRRLIALPPAHGLFIYIAVTGLVLVSFMARLALDSWIGHYAPLLPFIVAVVVAAGLYGVTPGLFAICLSSLMAVWGFASPDWTGLTPEEFVSMGIFIVGGGVMLLFANHLRMTKKRAEKLELELQQAQAKDAMGTMISILAHELNQPLTAASNYIAACHRLTTAGDEKREIVLQGLHQAEAQIQRAGSIIRHARGLVRNLPVQRNASSLRRMIDRVIDLIKVTEPDTSVQFGVEIASNANFLKVNTVQIEQVLFNLLRNAHQAVQNTQASKVRIKATLTDRGRLIEVKDSGPGIPRVQLPTLFSAAPRFRKAGLGIGLSICRTIVEAHGGRIWAQNNPEGGASFFVLLPDPQDPVQAIR